MDRAAAVERRVIFPKLPPEQRVQRLEEWVKKIIAPGYRAPPIDAKRVSYPSFVTIVIGVKVPGPQKEKPYPFKCWQEL